MLARAGGEDADMIIAVTNSDETNMVACQVAYTLFQTPTKIARVRANGYLDYPRPVRPQWPADRRLHQPRAAGHRTTSGNLIEHPGALQVLDFADGRVRWWRCGPTTAAPWSGHDLRTLYQHMPKVEARVAAIYRKDRAIEPDGDTVIEADDEVFFIARPSHIRAVMGELRRLDKPYRRLIFAGGGNIGTRLAQALESDYRVKVIERDLTRCRRSPRPWSSTIVLHGDAADEDLLLEENIEDTDVFCAVTNDDEANILSAMLAKRLGARKVMALINRPAYVGSGAERPHRHRHLAPAGHHRQPAPARAPRRCGGGPLPAARGGRGHRGHRPRRPQLEQGRRPGHRADQAARGGHHWCRGAGETRSSWPTMTP